LRAWDDLRATVSDAPIERIDDPRLVRALSHPLRVRVLAILDERTASAVEIARMLRAELGVVAYHMRKLHELGLLTLEKEVPVRGALQRFYRARPRPTVDAQAWSQAPPVAKQALIGAALQQINDFAQASSAAGGFDRSDAHITRTAIKLDEEGFKRLADALDRVLRELDEIEADAARRQADGESVQLRDTGLVMLLFDALPVGRKTPPEQAETNEHPSSSGGAEPPAGG
jgi:DNA-binding transcriptional ArsR family regulator